MSEDYRLFVLQRKPDISHNLRGKSRKKRGFNIFILLLIGNLTNLFILFPSSPSPFYESGRPEVLGNIEREMRGICLSASNERRIK